MSDSVLHQQHYQYHNLNRYRSERQDQRPIWLAKAHRKHFRVMGDAKCDTDNRRQDDQQQAHNAEPPCSTAACSSAKPSPRMIRATAIGNSDLRYFMAELEYLIFNC